jgi:hypothetical protein
MSFDARTLFRLLPAVLRIRDQAQAGLAPGWLNIRDRREYVDLLALVQGGSPLSAAQDERYRLLQQDAVAGPLASLLAVIAEQVAVLEEDLEQLYDDQFVETCADWAVPYIGDLIGYRPLHGVTPKIASPRAEVAHTIAYRRRKGTVVVLEQLARDVTGWNATAVEYFQRMVVTQYTNHVRLQCLASPDLRRSEPLERIGGAFDTLMRTVDVRRIATQRGRHNIPNVGLFLWRIDAYPLSGTPAVRVDDRRFRFHPLGMDGPLFTRPRTIADFEALATPLDVPEPISRRVLAAHLMDYYTPPDGATKSLRLYVDSSGTFQPVDPGAVRVCSLDDEGATWAHLPADGSFVVDPALGRVALPAGLPAGTAVRVDFHYGFSGPLGGGEYDRSAASDDEPPPNVLTVPGDHAHIQDALDALGPAGGVVLVTDSGRYEETLAVDAPAGKRVELRADDHCRPTLVLGGELSLRGGADSEIHLDGLLVSGAPLRVPDSGGNALARLRLRHCTLVPGWALDPDGTPQHPNDPSLTVEIRGAELTIERSILGGVRVDRDATASATDCILDATTTTGVAYAAEDGQGAGGALTLVACTVIGKLRALKLPLVSNSLVVAQLAPGDPWPAAILADRRQEGCVRFSSLPESARVPRRYRCLPESADSPDLAVPRFTSLRYGFPGYGQLTAAAGAQLLTGADNEGQPGAFNFLFQPQREGNLRARLQEYLRTGLEAGIFHAS